MDIRQLLIKEIKGLPKKHSFRYPLFVVVGLVVGAFIGIGLFTEILDRQTQTTTLDNFIIEEGRQEIKFFDREGNEILIIDNR